VGRDIELQVDGWRALVAPEEGGRLRALTSLEGGRRFSWIKQLERHADVLVGGAGLWLAVPDRGPDQDGAGVVRAADQAQAVRQEPPHDPRLAALDSPWQLTELSPRCVTLIHGHRDPTGRAAGFQAHQVFRLGPRRLEIAVALRNLGRQPMELRMGLRLQVPDGFSSTVTLDPAMAGTPRPARGTGLTRSDWGGRATLAMADGRQIKLRVAGALPSLTLQRHPERPWMTLTALTGPGSSQRLASGDEWAVAMTMELLAADD